MPAKFHHKRTHYSYISLLIYSCTIQQQQQQHQRKAFGVFIMTMNSNNSRYDCEEEAAGRGCFRFCCFDGKRWNRLQGGELKGEAAWFVKKLKEFSEVVEGPKWKNFIRNMGKYCNTKKSRMAECRQYDPQSYALNFDDGAVDDFEEDANSLLIRGFSSKFAPPPLVVSTHQLPGPYCLLSLN